MVMTVGEEKMDQIEPWELTAVEARALVRLDVMPSSLLPSGEIPDNLCVEEYRIKVVDLLQGYERIHAGNVPVREMIDWSRMLICIAGPDGEESLLPYQVNEKTVLQYAFEKLWEIAGSADEGYELPEGFLDDLRMLVAELDKPEPVRKVPMSWKRRMARHYELTGNAVTANMLGYIHHYVRDNHGMPEYEPPFRFFSIGHAERLYEAAYKLADRYAYGYGTVKNPRRALRLYEMAYRVSYSRFCRGEHTKFADVALRMGNCYSQGIGVPVDHKKAYGYYLQADLALRMRSEENYVGDSVVASNIRKALVKEIEAYDEPRVKTRDLSPLSLLDQALDGDREMKLQWKQRKDGSWKITVKALKAGSDRISILVTLPECDTCVLVKKIKFMADASAKFSKKNGKKGVVFDSLGYTHNTDGREVFRFYRAGKKCCVIHTDGLVPDFPEPEKPVIDEGKPVFMVSIRFTESGRCYDYVADDTTLKPGDLVIVSGYNGPTVVPVVKCGTVWPSELALPMERYKKILGSCQRQQ